MYDKKKLLIYAHYYYPDVASTGQLLKEQAESMIKDFDITVLCAVPSYEGTVESKYKQKKYYYEELNGVHIVRVRVPEFNKRKKISRIINILTYFFRTIWSTLKIKKVDYIFTISQPPILGGILGVLGKWIKHAKMIYCIQDFNPEQIIAVNYSGNKLLLRLLMLCDKFACVQSDLVVTVGRDLIETLQKRFTDKNGTLSKRCPKVAMINNWIDEQKIYPLESTEEHVVKFRRKYGLDNKFVFMYSGNIGLYYDLENLLKVIKKISLDKKTPDGRDVIFAFVGEGSIKNELINYVKKNKMENIIFLPYQDKEELVYSLNAADVHWCVNAHGIKGVSAPSKMYGIMAVGKPVLGVLQRDTEVELIIRETQCGLVCEPGEYKCVEKNILWFIEHSGSNKLSEMGGRGRSYLVNNLTKKLSIQKYISEIKSC